MPVGVTMALWEGIFVAVLLVGAFAVLLKDWAPPDYGAPPPRPRRKFPPCLHAVGSPHARLLSMHPQ